MRKAKTKCKLDGRCMPNVYYIHDNIWDEIALKDTSGSGYYLGSPATDFVERLWGLPVVPTDHLSDGTSANTIGAVVADTMYIRLWVRRGIHSPRSGGTPMTSPSDCSRSGRLSGLAYRSGVPRRFAP